METFYKKLAILWLAGMLISTQGVEAKPDPPKTRQSYSYYHYPSNHWKPGRGNGAFVFHQGRVYRFYRGEFYVLRYHHFIPTQLPVGMVLRQIPRRARRVHTRNGIVYRYRNTFFRPIRRGQAYVVIGNPYFRNRRGYGWGRR